MTQAGEHLKSSSGVPEPIPVRVYTVEYWLRNPFDLNQHPTPLAGFIPLEGLTNLEVLARLISLNGGSKVEGWGQVRFNQLAPYNFQGLANADEGLLLNAMLNFAAGMGAALGEDCGKVFEAVDAQITSDAGEVIKH